jgi:beta propeller repeat protein
MNGCTQGTRRSTLARSGPILGLVAAGLVFLATLVVVSPCSAATAPAGWTISQLTTGTSGSWDPSTDGEWLVWLRWNEASNTSDVMVRNLSTGEVRQVSSDATTKTSPLVSDDSIIWSTYALGSDEIHGYLYHLPSGPLEDLGLIPQPPDSYDDGRFAYRKMVMDPPPMHDEIYVYDLATKESTLVTAWGDYPSLRGSFLTYTSYVEGGDGYELFMRNLGSGQAAKLSNAIEMVTGTYLGESYAVWTEGIGDDMDVYLLDRTSGQQRRLTNDGYEDREPRVAGNLVVWESRRPNDWEIMVYDISSAQTTQLTDNGVLDMLPCTADGKVYWQSETGSELVYELFVAEPGSGRPFVDVPADHYYVDAIEGLYYLTIVDGRRIVDGKRYYDPNEAVNRAQFAKMVTGTLGVPIETATGAGVFVDLGSADSNGYPHKYVATILKYGVTKGVDATHYGPWRPITRAQVLTMFVRAANNLRPGFLADPPAGYTGSVPTYTSPDHAQNLKIAEFNGLLDHIQGFGSSWNPGASADRAECAQFMWNYILLAGIGM